MSPFLRPACRFCPSCSEYALLALRRFGLYKGVRLIVRRILKCTPFNAGGIDDVPHD